MGGFSAQVQQPQTSGGGKGGGLSQRSDGLDQRAIDADPEGFARWQQQRDRSYQTPPNGAMPQGGYGYTGVSNQYQQPQGPQPMAKGGNYQSNVTSGQPRMGQPNQYPNTIGQWDNAQIQPMQQHGKGKGG